tara:strand:- start:1513 stop:3249 length:1737 start_codon:yes stop_codon:yes gene_type:complete
VNNAANSRVQIPNEGDGLSPQYRNDAIEKLRKTNFDVLVVGGGITGVGCALDAASRGMSVALVEQGDIASGTSSRSSKLIHGGLRYLEQFQFALVKEALSERNLLLTNIAPHLVHRVDFLYPLKGLSERMYAGLGIGLYDLLARRKGSPLPRHRHLSKKRVAAKAPALNSRLNKGAIMYSDATVDDARYTICAARTAAGLGASIVSSARVTGLTKTNDRVAGALIKCLESGQEFEVGCKTVVNATGVWTSEIEAHAGMRQSRVTASKGIHLVVAADRLNLKSGMILRTSTSVLFVIPNGDHWVIGTTDSEWQLNKAHPAATKCDIRYLLQTINSVIASPLSEEDVIGVYAGLRPLLTGESDTTSQLSREHAVTHPAPGLVSISGGKYTTYRVMAAETIDAVGVDQDRKLPHSKTENLPLIGANGFDTMTEQLQALATAATVSLDVTRHLFSRHGTRVREILELIENRPTLLDRIDPALPYIQAEIVHAVRYEGALHIEDILIRRTRLSIATKDRGANSAPLVADLMASELGWDESRIQREIHHYVTRVESELASHNQSDDESAEASLLTAGEIRGSFH